MKTALIIFHRVDYDGLFSALIAQQAYLERGYIVNFLGYNYGDSLKTSIQELISKYNEICLVDISFNDSEIMKALYYSGKTILIDHHETCINLIKENNLLNWPGIQEIGNGACYLTFRFFYPNQEVPDIINRLSLYDVWNHCELDWETKVLPIQYALRTDYGLSLEALNSDIDYLFSEEAIKRLEEDGKFVLKYLEKTWKGWAKNYTFEVEVAGKFKGICMLTPQFGSMPFESDPEISKYQVFVCANKKKKTLSNGTTSYSYSASFYSTEDKIGNFSLGQYVKEITQTGIGGGHTYAAGMELTEEQFIKLITECTI